MEIKRLRKAIRVMAGFLTFGGILALLKAAGNVDVGRPLDIWLLILAVSLFSKGILALHLTEEKEEERRIKQ